jgi:hypothetical protein
MIVSKSEIRNPKSETNTKSEIRNKFKSRIQTFAFLGGWISDLFRILDFGFPLIERLTLAVQKRLQAGQHGAVELFGRRQGWLRHENLSRVPAFARIERRDTVTLELLTV